MDNIIPHFIFFAKASMRPIHVLSVAIYLSASASEKTAKALSEMKGAMRPPKPHTQLILITRQAQGASRSYPVFDVFLLSHRKNFFERDNEILFFLFQYL